MKQPVIKISFFFSILGFFGCSNPVNDPYLPWLQKKIFWLNEDAPIENIGYIFTQAEYKQRQIYLFFKATEQANPVQFDAYIKKVCAYGLEDALVKQTKGYVFMLQKADNSGMDTFVFYRACNAFRG